MIEEREVPGYRGMYLADSSGNIWSLKRGGRRKLTKTVSADGWARVSLQPEASEKHITSHCRTVASVVIESFVGPRPGPTHVASHINGNPLDDTPTNLEWRTYASLQAERVSKALTSMRVEEVVSNMTAIVSDIRDGLEPKAIAKARGVTVPVVRSLRSCLIGMTWNRGNAAKRNKVEQTAATQCAAA